MALHEEFPEPVRVAYTGTDLSFGLYGPHLKNAVYHAPINIHGMNKFHECNEYLKRTGRYSMPETDRIDFCRRDPHYPAWMAALAGADTDVLYVSVLHKNDAPHLMHDRQGFPIERYWAETHPESFEPLDYNRTHPGSPVRMYRVLY